MRLKTKKTTKETYVKFRIEQKVKNKLQQKANIYTDGNLSEFMIYAGLNFIPSKEDFETETKGKK